MRPFCTAHRPLRLVHDVHVSPLRNVGRSSTFAAFFEALENEGCQYLAEAEAIVRLAQPEIDVDVDLQRTDQVRLLIDWSEAACLLVLGFRGRCPLLVARPVTAG
jgi:hypothetical protein